MAIVSVAAVFFGMGVAMQIKCGPIARMLQKYAWGYAKVENKMAEVAVRVVGFGFTILGLLMAFTA